MRASALAPDRLDRKLNPDRAVAAAQPGANLQGVLVQKMAAKGRETILGMTRDPHFGPLLMFGLGGIYTEALRDVAFRLAPTSHQDAVAMLDDLAGAAVLKGVRGAPGVDREALGLIIVIIFPEIALWLPQRMTR